MGFFKKLRREAYRALTDAAIISSRGSKRAADDTGVDLLGEIAEKTKFHDQGMQANESSFAEGIRESMAAYGGGDSLRQNRQKRLMRQAERDRVIQQEADNRKERLQREVILRRRQRAERYGNKGGTVLTGPQIASSGIGGTPSFLGA